MVWVTWVSRLCWAVGGGGGSSVACDDEVEEMKMKVVVMLMAMKVPLTRYSFVILFDCCNPWSSLISLDRRSFDVIVGMDWLSKRKFVIVCHEKVVRIPLELDEILRVHGERTQGVVKTLVNTKTRVSYDLVIFREEHQCRLLRREAWSSFEVSVGITEEGEVKGRVKLRRVRAMFMTIQSNVKDKILATPSETSKVENAPAEMLHDLDQQMEKRERVQPRRVRAKAMTIQYGVRGMILAAQSEAFKQENALAESLHGLDQQMERKEDESLYFMDHI
ncbi:hypothetical protein Tco_1525910 [Tanacetum coccineum]